MHSDGAQQIGSNRDGENPSGPRWPHLPVCPSGCRQYRFQMPTERIGFINAILEAYDWIARIQTEDIGNGILRIDVPEDWHEVFESVMLDLGRTTPIRRLESSISVSSEGETQE